MQLAFLEARSTLLAPACQADAHVCWRGHGKELRCANPAHCSLCGMQGRAIVVASNVICRLDPTFGALLIICQDVLHAMRHRQRGGWEKMRILMPPLLQLSTPVCVCAQ